MSAERWRVCERASGGQGRRRGSAEGERRRKGAKAKGESRLVGRADGHGESRGRCEEGRAKAARSGRRRLTRRGGGGLLVEDERADLGQVRRRRLASLGEVQLVGLERRRRERQRVRERRAREPAAVDRAVLSLLLSMRALLVAQVEAAELARRAAAAVLAVRDLELGVVRVLLDALDRLDLRRDGARQLNVSRSQAGKREVKKTSDARRW